MATKLKLYICSIVLISFLFGCRTTLSIPPCEKRTEVQFPPDLIRYFDFKPGSYWIYEDSITRDIDSIWLYSYTEKDDETKFEYQKNCDCNYDKCFKYKTWNYMNDLYKYRGSDYHYSYFFYTSLYCDFLSNGQPTYFNAFNSSYINTKQSQKDISFSCRGNDSLIEILDDNSYRYDHFKIEPKLTLNKKDYKDVLIMANYYDSFYWVKDIGAVKIKIDSTVNKNLIRYYIVK